MSEISTLDNTNVLIMANVDYNPISGSNKQWSKNLATSAYDAGYVGEKFIYQPTLDQSIRMVVESTDKRWRIGICSFAKKNIGQHPELSWELTPASAESVVFSDDFTTDLGTPDYDNTKWSEIGSPSSVVVSGGKVTISGTSSCGLKSLSTFNMGGKMASAKCPVGSSSAGVTHGILLSSSDAFTTYWGIDEYNGNLRCFNENSLVHSITYNATDHLYKRIKFVGSTVYFETSPDGSTWSVIYSETSNASKSGLYFYLRAYMAGGTQNVDYDEAKISTVATVGKYEVKENNVLVYTSSRDVDPANELRIQIEDDGGGNLVANYYWRNTTSDPEQLEYTSTIDDTTLRSLFPIFVKGEIHDEDGIIKNLQIEQSDTGGLDTLSQIATYQPHNGIFSIILLSGMELIGSGLSYDIWIMPIPKAITQTGTLVEGTSPYTGKLNSVAILTPGIPLTKQATFNIEINGVEALVSDIVINNSNPDVVVEDLDIDIVENDKIEVVCTSLSSGLTIPFQCEARLIIQES